jgi:hypothetical protein
MDPGLVSQSFLGPDSDVIFAGTEAGIVGLCGGGSHLLQQLARVGIGRFVPVDYDRIENKNSNRLVGGTAADVTAGAIIAVWSGKSPFFAPVSRQRFSPFKAPVRFGLGAADR